MLIFLLKNMDKKKKQNKTKDAINLYKRPPSLIKKS